MNYDEQDIAKLIGEVEAEFTEYLNKSEQKEEVSLEKSEETEIEEESVEIEKSENSFEYDEEDIKEMNELYSSMTKSEAEAHYKSIKSILFKSEELEEESVEIKKSEENEVSEENDLLKSEIESFKTSLEESKKENEDLKKSIETLTSIVSKVVKSSPKRKAITQLNDINYIKKSEETSSVEKNEVDYSSMSKKEINNILTSKIRSGEIKKSEDRENINKFCHNELKIDDIKYLL